MSAPHLIQTVIECSIGLLLCVGFIFEDRVAAWEENLYERIKRR